MGMRKRKHAGFRSRKGPKRPKLHSGRTKKDFSSSSKNEYATSNRQIEEKKDIESYSSSSSDEEENPLKQLVSDLCKDSTKNQEDELSDEFVEEDDEVVEEKNSEEEQEDDLAEMGEEEEIEDEEDNEGEEEEEDDDEENVIDDEEDEEHVGEDDDDEELVGDEDEENVGEDDNDEENVIEDDDGEEHVGEDDDELVGEDDDDGGEEHVGEDDEEEEHVGEDDEDEEYDEEAEEVEETFASSSEEESDAEIEEDNEVTISSGKDPFVVHFESMLSDKYVEKLDNGKGWQKEQLKLTLGKCVSIWNDDASKAEVLKSPENNLEELYVRPKLINNLQKVNEKAGDKNQGSFSPFQNNLFQVLNSYQDLYYPLKNIDKTEEVEKVYCLHVINHVLKGRTEVLKHDVKLKDSKDKDSTEEFLDQGLTRPKVLIVVPFRETARRIVSNFIKLLGNAETQTDSKKRFFNEFSLQEEEVVNEKKPEDYKAVFAGNTDDHFRIGISLSRKRFKLYTKFYNSDIIIASPLGLRTVMGAEDDYKKDHDFLSSIEVLVLDQTDIFLMQNWEHVMHIMNHLHLQPKESHGCDFSRVRLWSINGWSKYYRQSIILSSLPSPHISLLFNKYCFNYAGKLQVCPAPASGSICQVALQLPLVFHKVESMNYTNLADARFNVFIKKILPKFKDNPAMRGTMVFIPSYFDFVRIRNFFNKKEIKFLQINEYSDDDEVSKTRSQFFLGKTQFLLYTERRHFYFRPRIRGVHHVIFYELPLYSHFFSEVCNMMYDAKCKKSSKNDVTGTVLYSKYDAQRVAGVVGTDRAALMINSSKAIHMFVTDS